MKVINPATEKTITELTENTAQEVSIALKELKEGQKEWSQANLKDRLNCIIRFGELIKENTDELAQILTAETGKPLQQSLNEINGAHNRISHLTQYAKKSLAERYWLMREIPMKKSSMNHWVLSLIFLHGIFLIM